jgi:hypothetical protein
MRKEKILLVGALGLAVATALGLSSALGQDSARGSGDSSGQGNQLLITHALDMAIEGSELQLTIHQVCCADAAESGDRANSGSSDASVSASATANAVPVATARRARENGQGCQIQLEQQARKSFKNSQELLIASDRLLRGESEAHGDHAGTSRLYAVANRYASSLNSIARENGDEMGSKPAAWSKAEEGQAEKAESTQDRKVRSTQLRSGERQLTSADATMFTLINHAVKESLNAFELNHSVRDMAASDPAVQELRNHAKAMAAEGRKSVNEILAGLHEKGTKSPGTTSDDKATANRSIAARAENQAGWSGSQVEALAQQAGEVIRVLDELGAHAVATPERSSRRSR